MNVQFAIQGGDVYVLEVNPRASRTVPYVSKATGLQLAKIAARHGRPQAGRPGRHQGSRAALLLGQEAVFLFVKFGVDTILGPEMKSTGEVMGVGNSFGEAFVKSQLAAGVRLPESGTAFISVKNQDKPRAVEVARGLHALGFKLVATRRHGRRDRGRRHSGAVVNKVTEGRPHIVDMVKNGEISLVINTVEERRNAIADSRTIRTQSLAARVTFFTTIAGARAAVEGMQYLRQGLGLRCTRCRNFTRPWRTNSLGRAWHARSHSGGVGMKWFILALFIVCATVVHFRGRVRHRFSRQALDHSTLTAPLNCFMYAFSSVPNQPYLDLKDFPS